MVGNTLIAVHSRSSKTEPVNCTGPEGLPEQVAGEESERARIERLGRERPPQFKSIWAELGFVYSIVTSQLLAEYFVSGFNVILPKLVEDLNIPPAAQVWPSSAFSLVTASFLLPFGRLADIHGGYPVYIGGLAWFCMWSLIAGFAQNELMLDFCRALQGLGPAAFLPSGVMLMGSVYRPGPRKNLVFSLYGGSAPLGFFIGIFFAGLIGQFTRFGWYFWIGTILVASTTITAVFAVPSDMQQHRSSETVMDWPGAVMIVSGFTLVVFAITDSSHAPQGWKTPYIYATFVVGSLVLCGAIYNEGWLCTNPLVPPSLFKVKYIKPLMLSLFLSYGLLGTYLLYGTLYFSNVMGASPLQIVAWYVPWGVGGCILSIAGGYVFHLIPGTLLMLVGGLGWILTSLLVALAPHGASYWAWVLPAMIGATLGIDITFNVANIFITTSLPQSQQGLAGGLINSLLYLGIAFVLGFADITQTQTASSGLKESYQYVFWYQFGVQCLALLIMLIFVRIRKAESDLTADEKAARQISANQGTEPRDV